MYRIGQFSKLTKTTVKTLRYYDEIGLLKPEFTDEENGYRYYTTSQLFSLHRIISLRQLGLSLNETISIISGDNAVNVLEGRRAELIGQLQETESQLSRIDYILSENKEDFIMNYQAIVKELPECIIYSKKLKLDSFNDYFEAIPKIGEEVTKANPSLKCTTPEYCFVVYLDGEYRDKDINIEYCEAVEKMGKETDGITFKKIKKQKAVCVLHKGSYKDLSKAYTFIFSYIEKNGYTPADNPRESYIDGIWNKENENDWLTEIEVPIE